MGRQMLTTLMEFAIACSVLILPMAIAWLVLTVSDKNSKKK